MKTFHWDKIDLTKINLEKTIWYVIYKSQERIEQKNKNVLYFDTNKVEQYFEDNSKNEDKKDNNNTEKKKSFLDAQTQQNLLIFLNNVEKWEIKLNKIYDAVKTLKYKQLIKKGEKNDAIAIDRINILLQNLPKGDTKDFEKSITTQGYKHGEKREQLDQADQFLIDLIDIDKHIQQRLKLWQFSLTVYVLVLVFELFEVFCSYVHFEREGCGVTLNCYLMCYIYCLHSLIKCGRMKKRNYQYFMMV